MPTYLGYMYVKLKKHVTHEPTIYIGTYVVLLTGRGRCIFRSRGLVDYVGRGFDDGIKQTRRGRQHHQSRQEHEPWDISFWLRSLNKDSSNGS